MGAGMLFLNEKDELLLVKPNYKNHWGIVGGVVDEGESPMSAAVRETKEEIGLDITNPRFLCVYWYPENEEKTEALQFVFYGGKLTHEQIESIALEKKELDEFKFFPLEEACSALAQVTSERVRKCYDSIINKTAFYGEGE
jgi:ADP-ribose pyrophosphatase YjhB (NUDIX family)